MNSHASVQQFLLQNRGVNGGNLNLSGREGSNVSAVSLLAHSGAVRVPINSAIPSSISLANTLNLSSNHNNNNNININNNNNSVNNVTSHAQTTTTTSKDSSSDANF